MTVSVGERIVISSVVIVDHGGIVDCVLSQEKTEESRRVAGDVRVGCCDRPASPRMLVNLGNNVEAWQAE